MKLFLMWNCYSVLTNGEIEVKLAFSKYSVGIDVNDLPDGVVFGQDNRGKYYLNGKPAHIEMRIAKEEF